MTDPKQNAEFCWAIRVACAVGLIAAAVPKPYNVIVIAAIYLAARFGTSYYEKLTVLTPSSGEDIKK